MASKEIDEFLRKTKLEFLEDYFSLKKGSSVPQTVKELREMSDERIEEIVGSKLFAQKLREELQGY